MELLHRCCAGLDVHSQTVVATVRRVDAGRVVHLTRECGTTTSELLKLGDWLESEGCTHVVMEATGVYWRPVWHALDGRFELTLANAAAVKNVPGRKSDVSDAAWLADLLAHGLVRGSFVPPEPIEQLRQILRTRTQYVRDATQQVQRIQKVLEDANIKVTNVLADVTGASGRRMLEALIRGETDPAQLAQLAHPRVRATPDQLREALRGRVTAHHRFLLRLHLNTLDHIRQAMDALEKEAARISEPFRRQADHLVTMPGVSALTACVILAEIGSDMTRFPTAGHLLSWAGLCPRQDESAGKHRSTRLRHGNTWLKTMLVQAAWAAIRTKDTYLRTQYLRLKGRRGPKKAIVAVAASMLAAAYHMLSRDQDYADLGPAYFDAMDRTRKVKHFLARLNDLGYNVELAPMV
jgi:transposase